MIFDKQESKYGTYYDTNGISIWSNHLTNDEKRQLMNYIKYGRNEQ
jgi:hypothetical protein